MSANLKQSQRDNTDRRGTVHYSYHGHSYHREGSDIRNGHSSTQCGFCIFCKDKDLEKLVAKNAYFMPRINQREISARVIAYNPARNKALVQVTHDCVPSCGEGWLVTVLNENGVWS